MTRIHPSAEVSPLAAIGEGTQIWHQAQVRERARIGQHCILGKGVYVDFDVVVGDRCKLQNGAMLYHGVELADGVFVGPGAILTNDLRPRAITPEGALKTDNDWQAGRIVVGYGASLGAGCVVLPDVVIGQFAMVGAGAVVTRSVPDHGLVRGNPARLAGYVCVCGQTLTEETPASGAFRCPACYRGYQFATGGDPA